MVLKMNTDFENELIKLTEKVPFLIGWYCHEGIDGMCKLLYENLIDFDTIIEILEEEKYEVIQDKEGEYIGYYRMFPGCTGRFETLEGLKNVMHNALQHWIRTAYALWKENKIINGEI